MTAYEDMEAAQKALRRTDYESDDEEEQIVVFAEPTPASPLRRLSTPGSAPNIAVTFDPYSPTMDVSRDQSRDNALFDDGSVHTVASDAIELSNTRPIMSCSVPGAAGYLEMEDEPPRHAYSENEPITTSSGLLLTHRRHSPVAKKSPPQPRTPEFEIKTIFDKSDPLARKGSGFQHVQRDYFEVEHGFFAWKSANGVDESLHGNSRRHSMPMLQARRFLSYVRIWMVVSAAFLMLATGVLFHAFGHHDTTEGSTAKQENSGTTARIDAMSSVQVGQNLASSGGANQIILVPMENISELAQRKHNTQQQFQFPQGQLGYHTHHFQQQTNHYPKGMRRLLEIRQEFEDWMAHHGKNYHSQEEKERRFSIWNANHRRTREKNRKHGPCKLTNQAVFGSTQFQDLSPEEFKAQFLTGYNAPREDELERTHRQMHPRNRKLNQHRGKTLKPGLHRSKIHESIKQRILQDHGDRILTQQNPNQYTLRSASCDWYDVSCYLRWLWNTAGIQFGSIVGTMEPKYDANAYPNALDWRDYGVVTQIRSQGNCGACWAITAVETVESAHAIATGNLYDLSEAEIITCDDSCEMCSGGWPQNAFEWVMDHGGLPLYNSFAYDGEKLLALTYGLEGTSSSWTADSVKAYREQVCPANSNDKHDSHDKEDNYWKNGGDNKNYADNSNSGRYGNIKGYGYATDRCICYSDGSGCGCQNQDEELAVANIASYGPAVVCVDASLWQDYTGGIMTADIGCGSEFMDVNHCVQVVGYAFTDGSNSQGQGEGQDDHKKNSRDSSSKKREGYWIVRNQWGGYWGMNGYAYVAMGENTCGILNDMTQAYL